MKNVLLTVSGDIDPDVEQQVSRGERPLPDYLAMAKAFPADLIDYRKALQTTGLIGKILKRLGGPNLTLAWACFRLRRSYCVMFTDGEQVGIPLALLFKLARVRETCHLMIAHNLAPRKKTLFFNFLHIHSHIDRFFVYSSWQKRFIEEHLGVPTDSVVLVPFLVDSSFFSPNETSDRSRALICAVGTEFRDYPTFMKAVDGLNIDVVIVAASPWSKRKNTAVGLSIPENVRVGRLSWRELRDVYRNSSFVVVPLDDVNFQAGVTSILEGMAMERTVICTRTQGQTDVVVDGETGLYVPPGDITALRTAITRLLDDPDEAERMGKAGRVVIEEEMNLDKYVVRLNRFVHAALLKGGRETR